MADTAVGRTGCASVYRPADDIEIRGLRAGRRVDGANVLEVGCGDGRLTFLLAQTAAQVVAIDPDAAAVRRARRRAKADGLRNVRFRVAPAQRPGVGRERFDTAVFSWSL